MESSNSAWSVVFIIPVLVVGILFALFPDKVIKMRARMQRGMLRGMGLDNDAIDRLPLYSALYGEKYSQRLQREEQDPKSLVGFILWFRLIGIIILLMSLIGLCLFLLALKSGSLS